MTVLYCIAWSIIAALATWAIMMARCSALISRLEQDRREEIADWQAETSRARATAAQVIRDAATRADAWKKGRDDVIAIMPLIAAARDSGTCSHRRDDDISESA
jgi:hypothetical protein